MIYLFADFVWFTLRSCTSIKLLQSSWNVSTLILDRYDFVSNAFLNFNILLFYVMLPYLTLVSIQSLRSSLAYRLVLRCSTSWLRCVAVSPREAWAVYAFWFQLNTWKIRGVLPANVNYYWNQLLLICIRNKCLIEWKHIVTGNVE